MRFLAALRFLTTIPLPWVREARPEELGRSTGYFPVVGIIIGLILVGLSWLFELLLSPPSPSPLPSPLVYVLLVVSSVVISGALHLDGFVDTCDGIAGHKTSKERWQVMSDSRVGAFGIIGVVLLLLVKYVALGNIPPDLLMLTLVLMPMVSRWAMVYAIFAYPYAKPSGLGVVVKQGTRWPGFLMATLITLVVAYVLARVMGLAIMLGIWIIAMVMAGYFKRKFSGLTGDTYGAINEVTEVSVLILVSFLARLGLA